MNRPGSQFLTTLLVLLTLAGSPAAGQTFEMVGQRALGMGGAFVAVANDSSATWWNPAGLATGPFLDAALGGGVSTLERLPGSHSGVWSFSIGTPPLGLSYYRLRITDIRAIPPTEPSDADRADRAAGVGIRSLSVSQFGATVLHTITTGVSAGATVKFMRGTPRVRQLEGAEAVADPGELLDAAGDLENGEGDGAVDVDLGVLAAFGAVRLGITARNVLEPRFGDRRLARQVRAGAAFDGEAAGMTPVVVSLDADLQRYASATGDRRVIAVGGERWLQRRRFGIRGGARFNTVGAQDRTVTAGASLAVRPGLFVEGHAAYGSDAESGWGLAARVSF